MSLTSVIVALPAIMLLAIITAWIPSLYARFHKAQPSVESATSHSRSDSLEGVERVESRVRVEKISPPHPLETVTQVPAEWTRVSLDRPARPERARIDETVGRTKRESVRQSWRSAMSGIGFAV